MTQSAVILSGFGGQGLLFAGQVLAQAGLDEGRHVTWLPSYGPEMRGGTASCTVIVADRPIGSPIADVADVVIALNPPSLMKFEPLLAGGGLLAINDSLVEAASTRLDVETVRIPCAQVAAEVGDDRVVSIVALGAAVARRPIVTLAGLLSGIVHVAGRAGEEAVSRNSRAVMAGYLAGLAQPA
jgi:2-oxoglutarate ferredoxin oxidoreductase subunit gamma